MSFIAFNQKWMNFSVGKRRTQHMCWVGLLPHPRGIENIHGIVALPWCLLKTRCFDSKKNLSCVLNKARNTFLFVNLFPLTVKKSRLFLCFVGVTYILKFLSNPKLLTPPRKKETHSEQVDLSWPVKWTRFNYCWWDLFVLLKLPFLTRKRRLTT